MFEGQPVPGKGESTKSLSCTTSVKAYPFFMKYLA
jgi:hypothetical protein